MSPDRTTECNATLYRLVICFGRVVAMFLIIFWMVVQGGGNYVDAGFVLRVRNDARGRMICFADLSPLQTIFNLQQDALRLQLIPFFCFFFI